MSIKNLLIVYSPESVERRYLTEKDIQKLIKALMKNKTFELVRDLFVFLRACHCGRKEPYD